MPWRWRLLRSFLRGLERDDFKRNAEDLGDFFGQLAVGSHFIACPTKPASHDLLAQELGHERPKPDDVRDRTAIPSFREHAHAHDAAHIASRGMRGAAELLGKLLKAFRKQGPSLTVLRPPHLADGVQRESHPRGLIALGLLRIGLLHDFGVNPDGVRACPRCFGTPQCRMTGFQPAGCSPQSIRISPSRSWCSCTRG